MYQFSANHVYILYLAPKYIVARIYILLKVYNTCGELVMDNYKRIVVYAKKEDMPIIEKAVANGYSLSGLLLKLLGAYMNGKIDPKILQKNGE